MKNIISFLLKSYAAIMAIFILQKVLFLVFNASYGAGTGMGDWIMVLLHGLRLDLVASCYLMLIPLLILLMAGFFRIIPARRCLVWWFAVASALSTIAFLADAVLYNFWGAKLDVADLLYAKNPKDMLASLNIWAILGGILAAAGITYGSTMLLRLLTPTVIENHSHRLATPAVMVLILGLNLLGMRGSLDESTANPGYAYFSNTPFLNHAALNPLFNLIHSMGKSEDLSAEFHFFDEPQLEEFTRELYVSDNSISDTLLNNQSPNIVLLIWEGGGSLMADNDTIAPNYANLKSKGIYFSNCFANNFRTDRGLVSILNGWPGLPTTSVMKMSGRCANLPSLAKSMATRGYHSVFYYGGDINFTNMRGYLYETGHGRVHGGEDYAWAPDQSKWGADDQYLLDLSHTEMPEEPFFATFLTLSSHEPWTVPYRRLADDRANSFAYTDSCIGRFVDQLMASPMWDNLLLIIIPDHGVARHGESLSDIRVAKIPMLWLGGAVRRPLVIDQLMNQSDLAATLLAQMGISSADYPFSRNVMGHHQPMVVTHAFKNGINIIDSNGSSRFDCVEGNVSLSGDQHRPDADQLAKAILQLTYSTTSKL